jgi:hypothetical protein
MGCHIALYGTNSGKELTLGAVRLHERICIPTIQRIVGATDSLHVLLRHRPRSIPELGPAKPTHSPSISN